MFQKAEKKKAKLKMALDGPSGAGKTFSALRIATGLGGPIAMLDTENGSGELYADKFNYDVAALSPPYTPEKYIEVIQAAHAKGYNVLIIDSLSHAWTGTGGLLDIKERAEKKTNNSFTAWREVTPKHNALVDAILQTPIHVIATMRTKTAYDMVKDEKGKVKPVKVGLSPIQRDGMEYEFTIVLDILQDEHTAMASKDRTGLFDGEYFTPTEETGRQLLGWLDSGKAVESKVTEEQRAEMARLARAAGIAPNVIVETMEKEFGKKSSSDLTFNEANILIQELRAMGQNHPATEGEQPNVH